MLSIHDKNREKLNYLFVYDDLLYNVLLAAGFHELMQLCKIDQRAKKICHSKEFLIEKFALFPFVLEPTFKNLTYIQYLYKISDLAIVFLKKSSLNRVFFEDSSQRITLWIQYNKEFIIQLETNEYPINFNGIIEDLLVTYFISSTYFLLEYYLDEYTPEKIIVKKITSLYKLLNDVIQKDIYEPIIM